MLRILAMLLFSLAVIGQGPKLPGYELPQGGSVLPAREMLTLEMDGELTLVGGNVVLGVSESGMYDEYHLFAEVRNDGDEAVYLTGKVQFLGEDGAIIKEQKLYGFFPALLEPGQTGYITTDFEEAHAMWGVSVDELREIRLALRDDREWFFAESAWHGLPGTTLYQPEGAAVEQAHVSGDGDEWSSERLRITYRNDTGLMLPNPSVAVGAYDAEGKLLYVLAEDVGTGYSSHACYIPDGSACVLVLGPHKRVAFCLERAGEAAAEYRSIVYGRLAP